MSIVVRGYSSSGVITKGYSSGSASATEETKTGGRRRRQKVLYVEPEKKEKKNTSIVEKYAKVLNGEKLTVSIDIAPDVVVKLLQKFLKTELERILTKGE